MASSQQSLTSAATTSNTRQHSAEPHKSSPSPWQPGRLPTDKVTRESPTTSAGTFARDRVTRNANSDTRDFELKALTVDGRKKQRGKADMELSSRSSATLPAVGCSGTGKGHPSPATTSLTSVIDKNSPLHQSHQVVRTVTGWGRLLVPNVRSPPPEPEVRTVVLVKTEGRSLGFTVRGGIGSSYGDVGIYVSTVSPGGLAAKDGRMREGDELLEVNGQSFANCTHEQAASVIKVCNQRC